MRNPFELRAEDLPEQPNYFSLLTIRIMVNKWLWLAVMISSKVLSEAELSVIPVTQDVYFELNFIITTLQV